MGFDPNASDTTNTAFAGTSGNTQALYSLSDALSIVPVKLKKTGGLPSITPGADTNQQAGKVLAGGKDPNLMTYSSALDIFAKMTPDMRSQYQQALYEAGIYKPSDSYSPGEFDEQSANAWATAVDRAAKQGISITEVLDAGKEKVTAGGGVDSYYRKQKAAGRAPLVTKVTNPEDLHLVAQQVATKVMGRNFTDEELAKFTAAYHGTETAAQAGAYGAAASGGTVTAEASPEAAATAFAKSAHPTEFAATGQVKVMDKILQMLGGTVNAPKPTAGGGATSV